MKELPFNHKERRIAYKNSVFNIYFDHLEKDGVSLVKDYLVVEPIIKKEDGVSGVAILPVKNNRFGLIKIYRHAVSDFCWEVPRGFVDKNENAIQAALRELKEETGLICTYESLKSLGYIYPEPGVISAKIKLFAVSVIDNKISEAQGELGHLSFDWHTQEEIEELIDKNKMNDATSQILYFKTILNEL